MKPHPAVDLYEEGGHWKAEVVFRNTWQARLFHWILNRSLSHAGKRKY